MKDGLDGCHKGFLFDLCCLFSQESGGGFSVGMFIGIITIITINHRGQ